MLFYCLPHGRIKLFSGSLKCAQALRQIIRKQGHMRWTHSAWNRNSMYQDFEKGFHSTFIRLNQETGFSWGGCWASKIYTNLSILAKNTNEIFEYAALDNMITGWYHFKEPPSSCVNQRLSQAPAQLFDSPWSTNVIYTCQIPGRT